MSLSATIAPHLPFLRRFSRAVSGSQASGDALVAAMLEALIADTSIFPKASSDRIALYKVFAKLFTSVAIRVPQESPTSIWEQRAAANLTAIRGRLTVTYNPGRYRLLGQAGTDWFWYAPGLPRGTIETDVAPSEPVR